MNEQGYQEAGKQQPMIENAESLADLPLTGAQAEAAKGGEGSNANIQNHPHQLSLRVSGSH